MARKKSHEEFIKEINELANGEYEVVGRYIKAKDKMKFLHIKCNNILETTPDNFISNHYRCKYCKERKVRKTHEQFIEEVYNLVGNRFTVLGTYEKAITKLSIRHNLCGRVNEITPNNFLRNRNCPFCSHEALSKRFRRTQEEYVNEVNNLTNSSYIVLGEYINALTKIEMKHIICNYAFSITPNEFINGDTRCPNCSNKSSGEKYIKDYLNSNNISYIPQFRFDTCKDKYPLPFDIAIFDDEGNLKNLIEYDGIQHFQPTDFAGKGEEWAKEQFEQLKHRDQIKNHYCKDNNIKLYRIPYWKFDEIEEILYKLIHNEHVEVDETSFLIV